MVERFKPPKQEYVGYRHPPKSTQFKPGESGNPKGRPRGSRTLASMLREVTEMKISVTEGGKVRRLPVLLVAFRRLVSDVVCGDRSALKFLLTLLTQYGQSSESKIAIEELLNEDRKILGKYLPTFG